MGLGYQMPALVATELNSESLGCRPLRPVGDAAHLPQVELAEYRVAVHIIPSRYIIASIRPRGAATQEIVITPG